MWFLKKHWFLSFFTFGVLGLSCSTKTCLVAACMFLSSCGVRDWVRCSVVIACGLSCLEAWGDLNFPSKKVKVLVTHSCLILCDLINCSIPGSSVLGILQARILEWVAIPFPGNLSQPGTEPRSPAMQADCSPLYHLSRQGSSLAPQPGIKLMYPTLAGEFLTTGPQHKGSPCYEFLFFFCH